MVEIKCRSKRKRKAVNNQTNPSILHHQMQQHVTLTKNGCQCEHKLTLWANGVFPLLIFFIIPGLTLWISLQMSKVYTVRECTCNHYHTYVHIRVPTMHAFWEKKIVVEVLDGIDRSCSQPAMKSCSVFHTREDIFDHTFDASKPSK
jgi:hypothetical protein